MAPDGAILVVEDDPDIREALCEVLRDEGYGVDSAVDGSDALARLRAGSRPDVILLDLMMPVLDGIGFRSAQLHDPQLAGIPVVVLSADGRYRAVARALGAAAAFAKPFELEVLLATVARLARVERAPAASA